MNLKYAQELAAKYKALLEPYCERIEIAGSIRRLKPECGDIEIVCIPRSRDLAGYVQTIKQWHKKIGDATAKYTQRLIPEGYKLDIFTATPENWGYIFAIRTGSSKYSAAVLARGWVKAGYRGDEGYLRCVATGLRKNIYSEKELFALIGIPYVPPEKREW